MSGRKIIEGAEDALAVAKGEKPAARIWHNGHWYVPEVRPENAKAAVAEWLDECETDGLRIDRLLDDIRFDPESVTPWLEAAWRLGNEAPRFIEPASTPQPGEETAEKVVGPAGLEPATRPL